MPQQITGVTITDHGDGTCAIQMGPNGVDGIQTASLFDHTTFQTDQLLGNIRLAKLIGNYGNLASQEFATRLNSGVQLATGTYSQFQLTLNSDGTYTVGFGKVKGGGTPAETITVQESELEQDTLDLQMVVYNLTSFLRVGGYTSLTPAALAAVAAHHFWY